MNTYAQTNVQLFNQLHREGYSKNELSCIRNAYELARREELSDEQWTTIKLVIPLLRYLNE